MIVHHLHYLFQILARYNLVVIQIQELRDKFGEVTADLLNVINEQDHNLYRLIEMIIHHLRYLFQIMARYNSAVIQIQELRDKFGEATADLLNVINEQDHNLYRLIEIIHHLHYLLQIFAQYNLVVIQIQELRDKFGEATADRLNVVNEQDHNQYCLIEIIHHLDYLFFQIIDRYDLVVIQELRDASGESIVDLLNAVNAYVCVQ